MSFSLIWESESQVSQAGDDSIENIQAGVDAQVLQNSEAAQVVLDDAASADKVVQGVGQLAQVKDYVDAQVAQGGMSEQTAQLAQIHVESICAAMRMPIHSSIIPKAENFGSAGSKLQSSRLASEGISDSITKGWEALKKFVARLIEGARNTWSNLWNSTMLLEKKLESLEKKLSDLKGDVGTDDIDVSAALKMMGQKTFDTAGTLGGWKSVSECIQNVKGSLTSIKASAEAAMPKSGQKGKPIKVEFVKSIATKYGAEDWKEESGTWVGTSAMLPGCRVIKYYVSGKDEDGAKLSIEVAREELKGATEKMKPLDKAAIKAALGVAREAFTALKKVKEDASAIKEIGNEVNAGIESVLKIAKLMPTDKKDGEKADYEKDIATRAETVKTIYATVATFSSKLAALVPTMNGEMIRGIMAVCGQSMSSFKEKSST